MRCSLSRVCVNSGFPPVCPRTYLRSTKTLAINQRENTTLRRCSRPCPRICRVPFSLLLTVACAVNQADLHTTAAVGQTDAVRVRSSDFFCFVLPCCPAALSSLLPLRNWTGSHAESACIHRWLLGLSCLPGCEVTVGLSTVCTPSVTITSYRESQLKKNPSRLAARFIKPACLQQQSGGCRVNVLIQ